MQNLSRFSLLVDPMFQFPLLSRSRLMERLISEAPEAEKGSVIELSSIPGGDKTFELAAKFCYGVKLELTAANVVYLRCAAEHLEMTEEYGENNLLLQTENFLDQVVLRNWKDSLRALETCDDDHLHSSAEDLQIPSRCIESMAAKACTDPSLFGWPIVENPVLWNGLSAGDQSHESRLDWWYEDASSLSISSYKKLISAMEVRGMKQEIIAGSLVCYARRYLPGLQGRNHATGSSNRFMMEKAMLSEEDQRLLVEEISLLLPTQKGLVPPKFLCSLLKTARILHAKPTCISGLERRVGMQLDQASLEDLLMPNLSHSAEVLYDTDCVHRILEHFLSMDRNVGDGSPGFDEDDRIPESSSLTPMISVAKLIDGYLAEVAPDVNLKLSKFHSLAAAVPEYARPLDDGLYRAIDIYMKSHPWLVESDRETLCRLMVCQKLSPEGCTHAAQNERLPLRTIIQVLFFEQLQLRTSISACFLASDELEGSSSQPLRMENVGSWERAVRENQLLKVSMDSMRARVSELERECSKMRLQIGKLSKSMGGSASTTTTTSKWGNVSKKFSSKFKSQMCSAQEGSVSNGSSSRT